MEDGIWKSYVSNGSHSNTTIELDNMSGSNPVKNKWYLVRIIYDSSLHTFDIYIDGKKANSEPIAGAVYNSDQNGGNNINRFRMGSVTGKDTFFDDIKAYSYPTDVDDVIDTRVKFSKTTANYVGSQNIELSTELEDAVIYYTTDGKYPDGSATKYTGEISVDSTTTIRAVAGYGEGASFIPESVAYSETYTILAKSNIKGDGIYRSSATVADVLFISDVKGEVYYYISDKSDIPDPEDTTIEWIDSGVEVEQNTTAKVNIKKNGLESGAMYINVVVKDSAGYSNVLQYYAPYDVYLKEGFTEYLEDVDSSASLFGTSKNYDKIIKVDGDNALSKYVNYYNDRRVTMANHTSATWIINGDIRFEDSSDGGYLEFASIGVGAKSGKWYARTNSTMGNILLSDEMTVQDNIWYSISMVYDRSKGLFDVYIDGKKINSESIETNNPNESNVYLQTNGVTHDSTSNTTYYDNIEAYRFEKTDNKAYVNFSPQSRTYTSDLTVNLDAGDETRTIIYTTDGTYPEYGNTSTKVYDYTNKIVLKKSDTKVTALAGKLVGGVFYAESIAYSENYTYLSTGPTITGESYNRHEVTTAYSWFFSDAKGKAYYTVNGSDTKLGLEEIKRISDVNANTVFDVEENKVTSIKMTQGMAQGEKYAHIIVEDQEGNSSNELVLHMPYDNMRYDSFTEFPAGTGSVGSVYNNKSGSGSVLLNFNDNRKTVTDPTDTANKVYAVTGIASWPEHDGTQLGSYTDRSTIILEGRWMSQDTKPSAYFAYGLRYNQGICIEDGVWKSLAGIDQYNVTTAKKEEFDNAANLPVYAPDTWYSLRIVYDYKMKVFDAYIDGIKANDKPIELGTTTPQNDIMASSLGTTTSYFDDIVFYTLPYEASGNITLKDSIVSFSPTSRTYTSEQKISLSTNGANKDIYYAIDGKYPNPTASGTSTGTEKYDDTDKFTIDKKTTTVRAIAGYTAKVSGVDRFFAESVAHDETYTYLSEGPKINGQSISRTTESNVYVWFYSDSAGKAYYKVTESETPVEGTDLKTYITENNYKAYDVLENKVNAVKMTEGMSTGKKYAHVIVEDAEGNFSNELVYEMPYDRFRYDDFEEFKNGTKVKDATVLNTNNVLDSNYLVYGYSDKAMNVTDPTDPDNNVYKVTGTYPVALNGNSYYGLGGTGNGTIVLEGRMMSELSSPTAYFAFGDWWNEGVCLKDGVWSSIAGVDGNVANAEILKFDNADEVTYSPNIWFTIRIVYDIDKGVFDAYV